MRVVTGERTAWLVVEPASTVTSPLRLTTMLKPAVFVEPELTMTAASGEIGTGADVGAEDVGAEEDETVMSARTSGTITSGQRR